MSDTLNYDVYDLEFLKSTGASMGGTDLFIMNPDHDVNGEICYKERHKFMGYYKNEQATR